MSTEPGEVDIADLVEAWDLLTDRLERYRGQLEGERAAAEASDDPRYVRRVTRGIKWSDELIDVLDDVLESIGSLRHNDNQLKWARQGKMV